MEWTGGSPKKRKDEATGLAVAAGVIDQVGLVTLHKKPRVNEAQVTTRKKVEEEGDGTESVTTALSMQASTRIDAPSPPSLQRPPRPEDEANDGGGAREVVEELTTVAELVKKGGSGMLVRRPALGHRLAVFWRCDRPYVLNDACPHRGGTIIGVYRRVDESSDDVMVLTHNSSVERGRYRGPGGGRRR